MMKRIVSLVLCLAMVAGMIPSVSAFDREFRGESPKSVDQCCHTQRVNPLDVNYVRPAYDGYLIEITPQRVEDTFDYLDEHYVKNHPEQALDVYTGTVEDRENLKKLAETITEGCTTAREKADAIDRWLYRNIYYDVNTSAYAYDTFYNRTGNCLSYANLMQFLLRSLGIPAVVGDGWRGDMKESTVDLFNYEGHAWCFVYLDGEWVLYDPLWIECGTTDRDYIAEWIYLDTVEFITPASDGDNLPPEAWDKPKVYYTDGRWYNFDNSHPTGYGNFTMMVNNQSYNFTPCQDEGALGLDGGYDGWYILDGKNDKSGMQLGEIYRNSWLSYGEYESGMYLNLTYAYPNGMQIDGAIMEYDGVERYMQCNTSFPVLAEEEDYTMQYGCLAFKPGYVGPFVAPSWGSAYDTDFHIVTWESDTPEVCTVDENGILTAVAPGFAQVRLTLSDQEGGGYYCITNINVCVSDEERIPQLDSSTTSGTCGESLTWELTDGVLTISGTGAMYDYEYMEAPWCDCLEDIRQIVIQDGVTRIGQNAFREALNVTAVSLSDSITEIGSWVFMNMEKLAAVTLPRNLTYLGQEAFMNCIALQEIELPGTLTFIDAAICTGCTSLTRAVVHGDPDIPSFVMGNSPFRYCTALEAIEVDGEHICLKTVDGVLYTYSGDQLSLMQYPAGRRETVWNIPEGTVDIGQLAVEQAQYLEEVSIPGTVYEIWPFAFARCQNLHSVSFAGDAPVIQEYVFSGVEADVFYPAGNATWTADVMQQYGGTITWVPYEAAAEVASGTCGDDLTWTLTEDGTLTISGTGAMDDAEESRWEIYETGVTAVVIEDGVTAIGDKAFSFCSSIESVVIPDSVTSIGDRAFECCFALTEITIPDSVTTIGEAAFMSCFGLNSVTIPDSVTHIGALAFYGCTPPYTDTEPMSLTSVNICEAGAELGLREVYIGSGVSYIGPEAFANCVKLEGIYVDAKNAAYANDDRGVLFDKAKKTLIQAPGALSGHYVVPQGVTTIGDWALSVCPNLTGVTIPDTVTSLGDYAFSAHSNLYFDYSTTLREIHFEGNAPRMGQDVFWDITATAYYPAGNATWTADVMQNYGGTITWVPYGEEEYYVKWYSGSTSLNGTIDLNMYVLLSENLVKSPDAFVRFTFENRVVDVPMAEATASTLEDGTIRYRFSCELFAKQIADTAVVQVMKGNTPVGDAVSYSAMQYCINQIKKADAATVALCKAMLNYGAAAQQYFDYNTDNLANASLSEADRMLPDVDASAYKHSVTGSEDGIKARSATLMLESEVKVRVYFTLTGSKTIDAYTFTIDGKAVTPQYNDKGWYVETDGIAAKDLEKMFEVKVGGVTVYYGALSYVNSKHATSDALEASLARALFCYYQAAEALLG